MNSVHITQAMRERLGSLEAIHGRITPAIVVEDAKVEDSPLHGSFTWDTEAAAYQHWLDQARTIIRSVRLISSEVTVTIIGTPHYVRDPSAAPGVQGYVSVTTLQGDPALARESLRLEFSRVEGALTRAHRIAVVLDLEDELEDLIAHVSRVREKAELVETT